MTVEEAANALGITGQAVRDALRRGELARVDSGPVIRLAAATVDTFADRRRTQALARIGDPAAYAAMIVHKLRPPTPATVRLADGRTATVDNSLALSTSWLPSGYKPGGRAALQGLMPDAFAAFGRSVLEAAAVGVEPGTCRWCLAELFSRVRGDLPPGDSAALRILLGSAPCPADQDRWARRRDARQQYTYAALDGMRQKAARQAQARVSAAAAQLSQAQSAAAAVDRQSGSGGFPRVTGPARTVLELLARRPGLDMTAVALATGIPAGTLVGVVNQLLVRGHVRRTGQTLAIVRK